MLGGGVVVVVVFGNQWGKQKDASARQEESALQLQEENNLPRQQLCREGPGGGLITSKTRS